MDESELSPLAVAPAPPVIAPPVIPPAEKLKAGLATVVFAIYFAAQLGAAAVVMGAALGVAAFQGTSLDQLNPKSEVMERAMAPTMLASVLGGGVGMFAGAWFLLRDRLRDRNAGAAWVLGPGKRWIQGFGLGMIVALVSGGLMSLLAPLPDQEKLGPLTKMGLTPGMTQVFWIVIAVLLAPPIEELLFRGVLFSGFRNSFGAGKAAVLTTTLFVLLHIAETIHFLPAMLGIAALASVALWVRIRTAAVGPAIAVHMGYNGIVALGSIVASLSP